MHRSAEIEPILLGEGRGRFFLLSSRLVAFHFVLFCLMGKCQVAIASISSFVFFFACVFFCLMFLMGGWIALNWWRIRYGETLDACDAGEFAVTSHGDWVSTTDWALAMTQEFDDSDNGKCNSGQSFDVRKTWHG